MREFDPSMLTANPTVSNVEALNSNEAQPGPDDETAQDIANDPFAAYFDSTSDPSTPPKVLITTSPQAGKATYEFCDELVGVFPGAEFVRRKKGKGFEVGRIAGWAAGRGYGSMVVVNEDHKKPSECAIYWYEGGELIDRVGRCYYCGSFAKWTNCLLQTHVYRTH
jgi:ribosome production factor 1